MNLDPQTLQQIWDNLLFGFSIPFQLLDLFLPDGWEIALLVLASLSTAGTGIIIYVRKKYYF